MFGINEYLLTDLNRRSTQGSTGGPVMTIGFLVLALLSAGFSSFLRAGSAFIAALCLAKQENEELIQQDKDERKQLMREIRNLSPLHKRKKSQE